MFFVIPSGSGTVIEPKPYVAHRLNELESPSMMAIARSTYNVHQRLLLPLRSRHELVKLLGRTPVGVGVLESPVSGDCAIVSNSENLLFKYGFDEALHVLSVKGMSVIFYGGREPRAAYIMPIKRLGN